MSYFHGIFPNQIATMKNLDFLKIYTARIPALLPPRSGGKISILLWLGRDIKWPDRVK